MSYHRGEPYVWEGGDDEHSLIHVWSNQRDHDDTGYAAALVIDAPVFDEIVVKRFCDMIREDRVPLALAGAARVLGRNLEKEMLKAARKAPKASTDR